MKIRSLGIPGSHEITLDPRRDDRGYFMRVYDREFMASNGLVTTWVQENQSLSKRKGTIRGLHFQRPPYAETKLVRVIAGAVLDVLVEKFTHATRGPRRVNGSTTPALLGPAQPASAQVNVASAPALSTSGHDSPVDLGSPDGFPEREQRQARVPREG